MLFRVACSVALALGISGCSSPGTLVEGQPYRQKVDLTVAAPKVFDALVAVLNADNLRMTSVSKDTGLLEVAPMSMSAKDMDSYCEFPEHDAKGQASTTFAAYHAARTQDGKPGGTGSVQMNFLVRPVNADTCFVNITTNWTASYAGEMVPCDSKGVFEAKLIDQLKNQLLTPGQ